MNTIKSSQEISYLFSQGKRVSTPYMTCIFLERRGQALEEHSEHGRDGRVAFIAGKKLGNAVWRNKAKRRLRAICRDIGGPWAGYDVVFVAKSSVTKEEYSKVMHACLDRFKNTGFFKRA